MKGDITQEQSVTQLPEDMPFVDIAAYLFLEDIADKQGSAGLNTYLISVANSLAKSMPLEEYDSWESFREAILAGESILSTFEKIKCATDNCMVISTCPFDRGWREYVKRVGKFNPIHTQVAEYYNSIEKPGAVNSLCVIHQVFRRTAADRVMVAGHAVKYAQIAAIWSDGSKKVAPDEWLPILLQKAGISMTELNMFMRNNACIYVLFI